MVYKGTLKRASREVTQSLYYKPLVQASILFFFIFFSFLVGTTTINLPPFVVLSELLLLQSGNKNKESFTYEKGSRERMKNCLKMKVKDASKETLEKVFGII